MTAPRSEGLIVVGVDGSPASRWALRWAASEALLRRTGLIITHVEPLDGKEGAFAHFSHLERLLARSAWAVASSPQAVPLSTHLVRGDMQDVGDELIRMSHRAAMLVLRRARLRPPAVRETLGTIESRLAVGAGCPIVLVSPQEHVETTSGRGVVVSCHASGGDDGTLDLAADEALLHGVPLTIVDDACRPRGSGPTEGLAAALRTLYSHRPGLVPLVAHGSGDPSAQVLALSRGADLLVIDCGTPGCPSGARQGTSPATKIMRAARCPLMLVGGRDTLDRNRIGTDEGQAVVPSIEPQGATAQV
jgi:nucleotide-binding universal stress UspA family protein